MRYIVLFLLSTFSNYAYSSTVAPSSWIPSELSPGDTFYVVYLSTSTYRGDLSKAEYDAIGANESSSCVEAATIIADSGNIQTFYHHLDGLNTTNLMSTSAPIYDVDGNLISSFANFWGGHLLPINKTCANSTPAGNDYVWTGFSADGTGYNPLGAGGASAGFSNRNDTRWARGDDSETTDNTYRVYLISSLLSVPVSSTPAVQGKSGPFKDW